MYNKLCAVLIGVIISVMITFNGVLASRIGNYSSIVIIHVVGIIALSLILLIKRQKISFKKGIPLYFYTGGAIGVVLTIFNNLSVNSLGVTLTLSAGILGQSIAATVIDHFGLIGMKVHKLRGKKIIGYSIVLCGIIIMTIY